MSVFSDMLALLKRPTDAPAPAPRGGQRRAESPPLQPATEGELVEALARLESERRAAEDAAIEAANRRERLLLEPTEDESIHAAGRDLDAAELLIERLDKLEPGLRQRLQGVRDGARAARWIELRDAYVAAAERHLAYLRDFETSQRALRASVWEPIVVEFSGAATPREYGPDPTSMLVANSVSSYAAA